MSNKLRIRLAKCSSNIQSSWSIVPSEIKKYFPNINETFREYTLHDEKHVIALESILDWLVTDETWTELNDFDIFCLICGLWSHDIGLGASYQEVVEYCKENDILIPQHNELTTFSRDNHASLSKKIIIKIISEIPDPQISCLSEIIGQIAESHTSKILDKIEGQIPITITGENVHLLFIAIVIRLADLFHCTHDRAPWALFKSRLIDNPKSVLHWKRHKSTIGINYDATIKTFRIHIQTTEINTFEWAIEYINNITEELDYCALITSKFNTHLTNAQITTFKVSTTFDTPFIPELVKFNIDPQAAINTLTGRYLYDDKSVFIRELLQNAIDACVLRMQEEQSLIPNIKVTYDTSKNIFMISDNGVGMTLEEIKNNLLKSCSSGFRKTEKYEDLIAKYGIGFLSTFLISESIKIKTRSPKSANGYEINISSTYAPIEIKEIRKTNIGTSIIIKLSDGEDQFSKSEFLKWGPFEDRKDWIEFNINGERLKFSDRAKGLSSRGPEFITKDFKYEDESFFINLRTSILQDDKNIFIPCGLSFQSKVNFPRYIIQLPDLKKRMYVGGIPLIDLNGTMPTYSKGNKIGPLFERYFVPIDLNIKKPGLIELNLSRTGFIHTTNNEIFFEKIDVQLINLLIDCYNYMVDIKGNRSEIAIKLISEYWLTRIEGSTKFPVVHEQADSEIILDKLKTIWKDVLCSYIDENYNISDKMFDNSLNSAYPTIFISRALIEILKNTKYDLSKLFTNLRKHFGDVNIIIGIKSHRQNFDEDSFISAMSKSIALYDLYESEIWHPPIKVFYFSNENFFKKNNDFEIEVYGSDILICGYVSNALGTGQFTGSNAFSLILNSRVEENNICYFRDKFIKFPKKIKNFKPSPRESILDLLASIGIKKDYLGTIFIHKCLFNLIPQFDPIKKEGTYFDIIKNKIHSIKLMP